MPKDTNPRAALAAMQAAAPYQKPDARDALLAALVERVEALTDQVEGLKTLAGKPPTTPRRRSKGSAAHG